MPVTPRRLILRRPHAADAPAIFERYASDPEVTRWLGWPRHTSIADTEGFLALSDAEWTRTPAGPYLIEGRDGALPGSTGFGFETPFRAMRLLLVPDYLEAGESIVALIPDRDTLVLMAPPADGDWTSHRTLARNAAGDPLCTEPLLVTPQGIGRAA